MKTYTLPKVSGCPNWADIPVANIDINYENTAHFGISAYAQLCWDDNGIHVHLQATEKNIRRELTGELDEVCADSCLEFFLRPTEALTYINIEFNPNCALWLSYGNGLHDLIRLVPLDKEETLNPKANLTEDGWEITYYVPFSFIRLFFKDFTPAKGLEFYGNFYKCGDETVNPHWFSWNDVGQEKPLSFHRPERYGRLILG